MLSSNVLITILPILALGSTAVDARFAAGIHNARPNALGHGGAAAAAAAKKHVIPEQALDRPIGLDNVRREATNNLKQRRALDDPTKKRKVKKRKAGCVAQTGFVGNSTATATATATGSVTSSPTDGSDWATTSSSSSSTTSSAPAATSTTSTFKSDWNLVDTWSGNTFFDNWDFWSWDDPTHGTVHYVDAGTAWNEGLISIKDGRAIMKVDTTQHVNKGRKSVRIHGKLTYTGGLVLMDAHHMPTGCGTWPAWWSNGPNWPNGGEIDILEGVNTFTQNQVSLHTGDGCTMPQGGLTQTGTLTTGGYDSYNCASYATSNQGCGVRDLSTGTSHGKAFNDVDGGVYALKWDKTGINVWWFPRSTIPADITADQPMPDTWGTPMANFPSTSCDPYKYFYDHFNIFDTTFCGDWAGADGIWNYAGYAGQDQSCAAQTGYSSCADYVLNNGNAFHEAYWDIAYVKYFNSTTWV